MCRSEKIRLSGGGSRDAVWDASETLVRRTAGPSCEEGPSGARGKQLDLEPSRVVGVLWLLCTSIHGS